MVASRRSGGGGRGRGRAVAAFHSRSTRSSAGRRVVVVNDGRGPPTVRRVNLSKAVFDGNEAVVPASTTLVTCHDHSADGVRAFARADAAYGRAVAAAKESLRSEYSVIQKVVSEKIEARKELTRARKEIARAMEKLAEYRENLDEAREKLSEEIGSYKQLLMNEKFKPLSAVQPTAAGEESSKLLSNYLVPLISVESDSNTKEQLPKQSTSETNEPRAHSTVNKQPNPNPLENIQQVSAVEPIAAREESPKLLSNNLVPLISVESDSNTENQFPKQSTSETNEPRTHPTVEHVQQLSAVPSIAAREESSKLLSNYLVPLISVESDSNTEEQLPQQSTSETNEPRAYPTLNKQPNPNLLENIQKVSAVEPIAAREESPKLLSNNLVPLMSVESDSNMEKQIPKQSTSETNEPRAHLTVYKQPNPNPSAHIQQLSAVPSIAVREESSKLLSNNLVPLISIESDSNIEDQFPKQSTSETNGPRTHPTVEHVQQLHKVQAIAAKKEPPKLLSNNLVPLISIESDNNTEEQLLKQSSSKTIKHTTHPAVKTQKTRSFVTEMKDLSLVTEDKPYYTCLWNFDSVKDDSVPEKRNSNLEVPSWRLKPFTHGYKLEGTEDMSDDFYNSRHEVLKLKEQKRKKWDLQQLREQKRIEHLKAGRNKHLHSQTNKVELNTLLPDPFNIKRIEVTNDVPVSAFGVNLRVKKDATPFKFYRSKWCYDGLQKPQKSGKKTLLIDNPLLDLYPSLT